MAPGSLRVAVVGGGIFGCAAALDLAAAGVTVELFEADSDILCGSTARNMARLHSGYHYPRSISTAAASRDAAARFTERWPAAVLHGAHHWYAIAMDSKISPAEYRRFLEQVLLDYDEVGRPAEIQGPPQLHTADMVIRADEAFVDINVLRRMLRREMSMAGIKVHLMSAIKEPELPGFDVMVWATYGVPWFRPLRYEVCEVALLELGRYDNDSFVVLDGDFVSLDPHGRRAYTLYDVKHSVHHSNVGMTPEIPPEYAELIRRSGCGPVRSKATHLPQMIESASRFLWGLEPDGGHVAIYHGSLWSIRAVLPSVDATDARPTLVERDGNVIRVLSGKIGTAAVVGRRVLDEVGMVSA